MPPPLVLNTELPNLQLRELVVEDAEAYFSAVDANRDHLSQLSDQTAANCPDLESVRRSITNPKHPRELRMGIWADGVVLVGSVNLTPYKAGDDAEMGYWLDARYTGQGYATVAARAMVAYALPRYKSLHASVAEGNEDSSEVLERVGFRETSRQLGYSVFELLATR